MLIPAIILVLLVTGAVVYSVLSVIAAGDFLRVPKTPKPAKFEPVSVLKPLAGLDHGLEENLRSFFLQDYPSYEILFAVRQEADPCIPLVRSLCAEYAHIPTRLILTGEPPYPHAKVFSLSLMLATAKHDLVVMSDSDIHVTPDLLKSVAAEFQQPDPVHLATCPYRAVAGSSIWSKMEAAGMNTTFWQGALTARMLDGMKFAVGPTIVARKTAIDAIGGMESIKDYLAEDFELGVRIAAAGYRVILSSYVVEHRIGSETAIQNFTHRIRWGRTSRRSRPAGYIGQLFTYPLPLALILWAARPSWWPIVAITIAIRYVAGWVTCEVVLRERLRWLLVPLEDLLSFVFWIAGFYGNSITWRGRTYRLDRQGRAIG
jgi:ceramide glucosyltransferase